MKIFITGGGGFIGSHVAEFYAKRGEEVVAFDNLSRLSLLGKQNGIDRYNWEYLERYPNVGRVHGDIQDGQALFDHMNGSGVVVHAAAQTAVTSSYGDPLTDFAVNAQGTLRVLETVRRLSKPPIVIYCSTNKVYGNNVNRIPVVANQTRYEFADERYRRGIDERFGLDLCERSPYGCSKLAGDLYMQDYARRYGLKIGVFRLSCVYGPRQFGVEDQGWIAWLAIATHLGIPITIYGDGKQLRDVLFISDLIAAFDAFVEKVRGHEVFNLGGGPAQTLSLLELIELLAQRMGKRSPLYYRDWRPNDQKVYLSHIRKARRLLSWVPKVSVEEGISKVEEWICQNEKLFLHQNAFQKVLR